MIPGRFFSRFRLAILLFGALLQALFAPMAHAGPINPTIDPKVQKNNFRAQNDILYTGDTGCAQQAAATSTGTGDAGGCGTNASNDKANEQQIFGYLTQQLQSKGFSQTDAQNAAAGIMGNWRQESGLNSYISGGHGCGGPGFGIAQWCGDRITKAQQYIQSQGKPLDCLGAQLQFAWSELDQSYGSVLNDMKGKSAADAALAFDNGYEKSTDQQNGNNNREKNATDILNEMNGGATPPSSGGSGGSGSGTSAQDAAATNNNCTTTAASDGSCKNPFRDLKNSGVSRVDGGYDYGGSGGSGPIYAACPSQITYVASDSGAGWPGKGNFISYQVTAGKAKGLYIYIAEDCTAKVKVGDQVDTNTPICDYQDAGTELETGWGQANNSDYVSWSDYHQHGGNWASNSGMDFDKFFQTLGLPHDNVNEGPSPLGPPAGWPQWSGNATINA